VIRYRLNRGRDRQASHALRRIVVTRMGSHPPARAYVARRAKDGMSKPEVIRCPKRYVDREGLPSGRARRDQLLANEPDVPALGGQRGP
jgi:hypothetical protein